MVHLDAASGRGRYQPVGHGVRGKQGREGGSLGVVLSVRGTGSVLYTSRQCRKAGAQVCRLPGDKRQVGPGTPRPCRTNVISLTRLAQGGQLPVELIDFSYRSLHLGLLVYLSNPGTVRACVFVNVLEQRARVPNSNPRFPVKG